MWQDISMTLDQSFWGNTIWQYIFFALIIVAMLIVRTIVRYTIDVWLLKLTEKTSWEADDKILAAFRKPAFFLVFIAGVYAALSVLTLPTEPIDLPRFLYALFTSLLIFDCAWVLYSGTEILTFYMERFTDKTESKLDDQLVPIVRRTLRILIMIMALVMIIQNLGYSVSSLLAGLGLGGLAFALAAKDSLANMFGSVTIFTDRPFQVGDWVALGGVEGGIEDVGFRSTRIRTVGKTLITIPNSIIANETIENFSVRTNRHVSMTIGVTYDATPEQLEQAVAAIRKILAENKDVAEAGQLVYFTEFGASSLDIFINYYSVTTDRVEWLKLKQEINLALMRKIAELGMDFAFPSQTLYLQKDAGA